MADQIFIVALGLLLVGLLYSAMRAGRESGTGVPYFPKPMTDRMFRIGMCLNFLWAAVMLVTLVWMVVTEGPRVFRLLLFSLALAGVWIVGVVLVYWWRGMTEGRPRDKAADFLREALADGPRKASELSGRFSEKTLDRAKAALDVKAVQHRDGW